jgi:tRNA G18 (ribose-2'-O)-methylase SpoU
MAIERLASVTDSRLGLYRTLSDADLLKTHGLFVAEGRLVVRRVIEVSAAAIESVLVSETAFRSLQPQLTSLSNRVPIFICGVGDFRDVTGFDIHRGCLALVRRWPALALEEVLAAAVEQSSCEPRPEQSSTAQCTMVVLEGVANADNVGGVFRNAAAFGAAGVLLDPTSCDPLYRKSIRTSMGSVLRVPFARIDGWPSGLSVLSDFGFALAALTPREPAVTIDAFAAVRPPRVALLVGAEGGGLSERVESTADYRVRIPIDPRIDSLNLAVATGIALHRLTNRLR